MAFLCREQALTCLRHVFLPSPPNNPQVAAVLPAAEQQLERAAAQGRLWANVFGCMMEAGRYEASAAV